MEQTEVAEEEATEGVGVATKATIPIKIRTTALKRSHVQMVSSASFYTQGTGAMMSIVRMRLSWRNKSLLTKSTISRGQWDMSLVKAKLSCSGSIKYLCISLKLLILIMMSCMKLKSLKLMKQGIAME